MLGTVSLRRGYIAGGIETVGYLGDLRVSWKRDAIRLWRHFFAKLIEVAPQIREFQGCRHFYTAVVNDNARAQNALVKGLSHFGVKYDLLAPYEMINLFWKNPFSKKSNFQGSVSTAEPKDTGSILQFLDAHERKKPFGYVFSEGELERRLESWPGLSLGDFLVARDPSGRVVGVTALWSPSLTKKIRIERVPMGLRLLGSMLKLPKTGDELKSLYLTHLAVEDAENSLVMRNDIFEALLAAAWVEAGRRDVHLLSFCRLLSEPMDLASYKYLAQRIPMALFRVHATEDKNPWLLHSGSAGFEMALV